MRVHAFLATETDLPHLLDDGTGPPPGTPLTRVDPVNLASLVGIVTGGAVSTELAAGALEQPILGARGEGPTIHQLPAEAVGTLASSDAPERRRWGDEWTGGTGRPDDGPDRALAELAARRSPGQGLYLWVADGS